MTLGTFSLCATLMALLVGMGLGQDVSKREATLLRKVRALRQTEPKAATAMLIKSITVESSDVYLFELGLWHAEDGDADQAIATWRELIKRNPNYPGAKRNLGILLLRNNHHVDAIKVLSELSRNETLGAELHRSLGNAFSALGNHIAALAAYRQAVVGFPNDQPLQLRIAQTLFALKSFDEATAVARAVLRNSAGNADAWLVIGNCKVAGKELGAAADALEAARRLSATPRDDVMVALGDIYVALGLPELAAARYAAAPKLAAGRSLALGKVFLQNGDVTRALAIATRLKSLPKHAASANLLVGLCELKNRRYSQAETALKLALEEDPANGETLAALGDLAATRADVTAAISWYRSARSSARWRRYAMEAELDVHLGADDRPAATRVLDELIKEFPSRQWSRLLIELNSDND